MIIAAAEACQLLRDVYPEVTTIKTATIIIKKKMGQLCQL